MATEPTSLIQQQCSCRLFKYLHCPLSPPLILEYWCLLCSHYTLVYHNLHKRGEVTYASAPADTADELFSEIRTSQLDKAASLAIVDSVTNATSHLVNSEEETVMPQIVEDFDPKIRRAGTGSGRPQIYNIDLNPLDQVKGRTGKNGPVFVKYTLDDLDGAADATFQQQVRNYAENMAKGDTKHGYRAQVRTVPVMEGEGNEASPVTDEDGKQVNDFYVAVVEVTDADVKRRQSYQRTKASNGDGSTPENAKDAKASDATEDNKKSAGKVKA